MNNINKKKNRSVFNILMLIDDKEQEDIIVEKLSAFGYDSLHICYDDKALLSALYKNIYKLLIIDIDQAHDASGIQLGKQVYDMTNVPIIYLFRNLHEEEFSELKKTEPWALLQKPLKWLEFRTAIENVALRHKNTYTTNNGLKPKKSTKLEFLQSLQMFESITNNIPLGILIYEFIEPDKLILKSTNNSAEYVLGINLSKEIGKEFRDIWIGDKSNEIYNMCMEIFKSGKSLTEDISYSDKRIKGIFRASIFKISDVFLAAAFENISESMEAIIALRDSEARYRDLVEKSGVGILVDDASGKIIYFNKDFTNLFGYSTKEMRNMRSVDLIHQDSIDFINQNHQRRVLGLDAASQYELKGLKKDGTEFWMEVKTTALEVNNTFVGTRNYLWDITERKKSEERLKKNKDEISRLSRHIEAVREEEQKRISVNLHDDLGQLLTALKMDLSWIHSNIPETEPKIKYRSKYALEIVGQAIESVQQIASKFRSPVIENLGLREALENLVNQFETRSNLSFETIFPDKEFEISMEMSISIYRIIQEAFTNIIRHADANSVNAKIEIIGDLLEISIKDDGVGIDFDTLESSDSLGLISMRERVEQWNGKFKIEGRKGEGTKVLIRIPLEN